VPNPEVNGSTVADVEALAGTGAVYSAYWAAFCFSAAFTRASTARARLPESAKHPVLKASSTPMAIKRFMFILLEKDQEGMAEVEVVEVEEELA